MAVALSTLTARLQAAVPPRDGVPADYGQLVQDAVLQLSQDVPMERVGTIDVVSGVATYDLPGDFLFLIEVVPLAVDQGVLVAPAGLIPVPDGWQERYYVAGGQLTIDPTPTYTLTRRIRYGARHELTGDPGAEVYERLTVNGARIALLYARYLALSEQANAVAGDGWRYAIGDETVDKTRQGDGLRAQAEAMLQAYRREVQALKGYGQRRRT